MRTKLSWGLFFLLAVTIVATQAHAQVMDLGRSNSPRGGNSGFVPSVAGSYIGTGEFSVDFGCDGSFEVGPIPFTDAQTFGVAGSHTATNPANPNTNHGTWKKTGPFQISFRDINFGVTAPTPGGTLANIAIISGAFDFDADFENATSTFGAKVYTPDQDPLDPLEQPIACSLGQHTSLRRVSAVE